MSQKVIRIGSSAGLTISPDILEALGIQIGDAVEVSAHRSARTLTVRPKEETGEQVNPDVVVWTNAFIDKNRKLLMRLADK